MDEIEYDFGFTAIDASEIEEVRAGSQAQQKLDDLFNAIMPLLKNLKKNPEKDHIYWPDRIDKVEAFEEKLRKIYEKSY